jgi:hypothetical protein
VVAKQTRLQTAFEGRIEVVPEGLWPWNTGAMAWRTPFSASPTGTRMTASRRRADGPTTHRSADAQDAGTPAEGERCQVLWPLRA